MRTRFALFAFALCAGCALACAGCAEEELERVPTRCSGDVVLSNREPGAACRALEAIEVRSGRDDEPTGDAMRAYAASRGANYVVVDTFSVYDEGDESSVLTRARLFACPALALVEE